MSAKLLKEINTTYAALVKSGIAEKTTFSKDFDVAKVEFDKTLQTVDTEKLVADTPQSKAFNVACELFDVLFPEDTEAKEETPAPVAKAKPAAKAKSGKGGTGNTAALAKARAAVKRDGFGFPVGSKANEMGKMLLAKKGCSMSEVKDADWNTNSQSMYNAFKGLEEKGLAEKRDGRMYATDKARGK